MTGYGNAGNQSFVATDGLPLKSVIRATGPPIFLTGPKMIRVKAPAESIFPNVNLSPLRSGQQLGLNRSHGVIRKGVTRFQFASLRNMRKLHGLSPAASTRSRRRSLFGTPEQMTHISICFLWRICSVFWKVRCAFS